MRKLILSFVIGVAMANAFGQELVFSEPVALSNLINTEDEELAPMLSPDGKTLYFIRAFHEGNEGGKYAGSDIWMSKKDDEGNWMPAARMEFGWNNKRANAVIGINKDQTVVYLLNAYSNKSGIAFSKFNSGLWGEPEFIPIPGIAKDDFVGFYVNPQFDVILISMRGKDSLGEEDIYLSLKDSFGNWTEPRNLGPTINTKGFEISPFLSEDKKRLYFSSNGHGGFGDADIFYCDRLFDSWETWSVPKNLGKPVNSEGFEGYLSIQTDLAHFSSSRINRTANVFEATINVQADTIEQKVKEIISQAQTIITDLKKSSNDISVRLEYLQKSIEMMPNDKKALSAIIIDCQKSNVNEITIIGYSSEYDSSQLNITISEKRLKEIMNSFRSRLGVDLKISSEVTLSSVDDSKGYVEIRYSRK